MASLGIVELLILAVICALPLVVLTILGIFFLVVRQSRQQDSQRVRCPHCAEWILPEAKVCRYCGREV